MQMTIRAVGTVADKFGRVSLSVLVVGGVTSIGPVETRRSTEWIGMEFVTAAGGSVISIIIGGVIDGGHDISNISAIRSCHDVYAQAASTYYRLH